ncbi:MAG: M48 family metallopeptidase, partial [Polyangia bacterium]
ATDALRSVPGLDTVVSKVMEYGFERLYYLDNVAGNVRVGPRQLPRLYRSLQWGCKILDVPEPELYVTLDPVPNAFTYGHTRPFVVMTSGLVDMLDDEERFFVLAHELGHIKAAHVLYTVLAKNIAAIMTLIGQATLGIGALLGQGLVIALNDWFRKAELTADRAGLLCVQDIEPCMRAFMKMAGGGNRLLAEMDFNAFVEQIRAYEDADRSNLNKAYKVLITLYRTHPFPILRAKELDAWHSTGYREIAGPRGLLGPARE